MQFRKLKRLASELNVGVEQPVFSFGEWELPFYALEGFSFNGQFTCSSFFVDDLDAEFTKGQVIEMAWEHIKNEAEEISNEIYEE
jgi:hypothetical protein